MAVLAKGHTLDPTLLREYDIRGIVGETLRAEDAHAIGSAYGTLVRREGGARVAVGYDGRLSSPELEEALVAGILATGLDVERIGIGPTPMLYFAVHHLGTDGGMMVTGSHNPPDYNGFKMMLGPRSVFGEQIQEVGRIASSGDFAQGNGRAEKRDIRGEYVERLAAEALPPAVGGHASVLWDAGNGATGEVLNALVERLPGRHEILNGRIDGRFPAHHPDPTVEANLAELKAGVAAGGFGLGIAFDGDGDRIGAIDTQGHVVWGDQLLAILARDVLAERPGATIIADVKASQVLFDEIKALGGAPLMWRTGHSLIKTKMAEIGAPLAGEMSGHIFFADRYYGYDDAIYAALRLIAAVVHSGRSLAELRAALPKVVNTPELRFPCPEERKFAAVEEVKAALRAEGANLVDIDGVRVTTPDGWWLLRASNTQAVLVARCEASTDEGLERVKRVLAAALEKAGLTAPDL